jgi:tetraacyldisaccharide 4'-kinase
MNPEPAVRWIWSSRHLSARALRGLLVPASAAYQACLRIRGTAYGSGWITRHRLPLPSITVGNLSVGGTGKTPIAAWLARRLAARGLVPAILGGSKGADEAAVHRQEVPDAIVLHGSDRYRAACRARQLGARTLVLDDGFQRLGLVSDVNVVLLSAERARAPRWLLPAGPWREPLSALQRANLVVVTRKQASRTQALRYARQLWAAGLETPIAIVHLPIGELRDLRSGERLDPTLLRGARVLAVCGVAEPESFAWQLASLGAQVRLLAFPDHYGYPLAALRRILSHRGRFDYVVVTHKDAVKLASRWPDSGPRALVARLAVSWERGHRQIENLLTYLATIS